jgi:uncharacterized protein
MVTMKQQIVLAGGSGFLGQALAAHFHKLGFETVILTRSPLGNVGPGRQLFWDARTLGAWQRELEGAVAIINLAGKSVDCRYHARNRQEILDSRVNSTRILGEAIQRCPQPPRVWLNASTATIYKHTLNAGWDESGEIGSTPEAKDVFSVEVAKAWEHALDQARTPRTHKIAMRTAMVLGLGKNSVFPVLRRLVHLGLGGKLASGRQFVSWIHEVDFCRAVEWLITHEGITGPVNISAPNPVSNAEMMRILREVCGAGFGLPASRWMLEVGAFLLGTETELVIKSRRVISRRLLASGFTFGFPKIREAFNDLCTRIA